MIKSILLGTVVGFALAMVVPIGARIAGMNVQAEPAPAKLGPVGQPPPQPPMNSPVEFDMVLLKYGGTSIDQKEYDRLVKVHLDFHTRNKVVTYPGDSHVPILVPRNRLVELKKLLGGEMLEITPELK